MPQTRHPLGTMRAAAGALVALLSCAVMSWSAVAQERRPNIIVIVADDAGIADIGSFGSEINTPNIDALASIGVRFTEFHVSPTCSPTRSMLLTGADNHVAGLGNMAEMMAPNQRGRPGYEGHLNDRVVPIPLLLREAGYNTYMAGKWHLGEEPAHWPAARGFMRDLTLIPGGGSHFEDMWGVRGERQLYTQNGKVLETLPQGFHSSENYTSAIIANIEESRRDGKPFFAYLALQAPHDPFQLPAEWRDRYSGRYDQGYDAIRANRVERMKRLGIIRPQATMSPRLASVPAWETLSPEERLQSSRRMELYAAMVEHMDSNIGRLIDYLKANNLFDNTIIVFMSDNGPEGNLWDMQAPWDNSRVADWGKPGTYIQYGPAWAQAGAGPFRIFKGFTTEGGIRAPLIIAGRGVGAGGRVSGALAHVMDLPATILQAANVPHPAQRDGKPVAPLQGKSLAPILANAQAAVRGPSEWIGWELFGNRAIRQGNWKLLWICQPLGPGRWQLYDLRSDPGETNDRAAAEPRIRDRLIGLWNQYARANNVILPDRSPVCAPAQ